MPWPREEQEHPEWLEGYLSGLVIAIEAGSPALQGRGVDGVLSPVHEAAVSALASIG